MKTFIESKSSLNENKNRSSLTKLILFLGLIFIVSIIISGAVSAVNTTSNQTSSAINSDITNINNSQNTNEKNLETSNSTKNIPDPKVIRGGTEVYSSTTIQDAIDHAIDGDTIAVDEGTYTENVVVNHRLNIIATGLAANTIVTAADPSLPVFYLVVDGTTIQGFTITGTNSSSGIFLDGVKNCNINNNTIQGFSHAIYLRESTNNNILGNIIQNNGNGISLDSSTANITNNNIKDNPGDGINVMSSSGSVISGNTITNTGTRDGSVDAIFLWEANNNQITGNTLVGGGISLTGSENPSSGNTIQNNNISQHYNGLFNQGNGISLSKANNNIITTNNITSNTVGIKIEESNNNQIYYNNIYNNGQNVVMDTNSNNNQFNTASGGNYWGSSSIPDNNNDGIIDNSYIIPGISDITETSTPFSSICARDTINNRTLMIWNAYYGPMNAIYGQIINDDGSPYSDTILISTHGSSATSVVFNPVTQKYLALWDTWDNAWICYGQFINTDGTLDGNVIYIDDHAVHPIGVFDSLTQQYLIAMSTASNTGYGPCNLFWEYLTPSGFGERHYITSYTSDRASAHGIIYDSNNNRFLITWVNPDSIREYAVILNGDGTPYTANIDLGHALDDLRGYGGPVAFDNINSRYLLVFAGSTALLMNSDGSINKTINLINYFTGTFNWSYMHCINVIFDTLAHKFLISFSTGTSSGIALVINSDGTIDDPFFYLDPDINSHYDDYNLIYTNEQTGTIAFDPKDTITKYRFIKIDSSDNLPYKNIIPNAYRHSRYMV